MEVAVKGRADLMPKLQAKKRNRILWQEVNRCLPAKFYRTPLARKRKYSAKKPVVKAK